MSNELAEIDRDVVLVQAERRPPMPVTEDRPLAVAQHACPKLSEALALARDRCKAAVKGNRNTHHNFDYASADEVIAVARAAMAESGIAIIPQKHKLTVEGHDKFAFHSLERVFVLSHSSGEFTVIELNWPVIPGTGRPLDKALATALTSSLAYWLRDLLQMPRGDDTDMSARDDTKAKAAPKPTPAPAPAEKSPAILRNDLGRLIREVAKAKGVESDIAYANLRKYMLPKFPDLAETTSAWDDEQLKYGLKALNITLTKAAMEKALPEPAREPGMDPEDDVTMKPAPNQVGNMRDEVAKATKGIGKPV